MEWLVLPVILFFTFRQFWRIYSHPAARLVRQAVSMGWVVSGVMKSGGYRNTKLTRDGKCCVVWFKDQNVEMIDPPTSGRFNDFLDIEHWLASTDLEEHDALEIAYMREVDDVIRSLGLYEDFVLPAQTEQAFLEACSLVYQAGYKTSTSPKVIGMLIADGAKKFSQNEELGILFLKNVAKKLCKPPKGQLEPKQESTDDIERKAENYHNQIDSLIKVSYSRLQEIFGGGIDESLAGRYSLTTIAVFAVHLATLIAVKKERPKLHSSILNGFARALSFRTPNTVPDVTHPTDKYVSYTSNEESYMHQQMSVFEKQGEETAARQLLQLLGGKDEDFKQFSEHLKYLAMQAQRTYLKSLVDE